MIRKETYLLILWWCVIHKLILQCHLEKVQTSQYLLVSNQTGHSYNLAVTYAKPEIKSIRASHNIEDSDSIYPTSGCLVHEQTVRRNFVGTLCDVRVTLRIHGKILGDKVDI